ncbi:MAG: class I SAM-dependent methyltransferase [Clostridia bacterium]|nr:class I SAM-dependent methyltransferase [Clostridia bacterium]
MKNTIEYYDDSAEKWAEEWYNNESVLPYLKHLMTLLPKNPTIVDLCCGAGYESMRLKNLGAKVIGLDLSKNSIKIAKERNPEISFYVQDMLKDYSYVGKVDGLICVAGLIHLENDKLPLAFQNMHTILNDNAYTLIVVREGSGKRKESSLVTYNGIDYDRNFICHTIDELVTYSKGYFEFVEKLEDQGDWRYYIFKKVN